MMIEQNTNYAYKLKYMDNPTFDKVRDLSTKFYRELPQTLQDELFEALNRGIDILDSEPQMSTYLYSFGPMHQAKLNYAFNHLPREFFIQPEINIIDYGCGQALGTICYADFLHNYGYFQRVRVVNLIEPSEICLKRAALHASVFFPNAKIKTVNKTFDELNDDDLYCDIHVPTLHILSNVLDILDFDLERFADLIKGINGYNQFVCVGPYFKYLVKDERTKEFFSLIDGEESCFKTFEKNEISKEKEWTAQILCFSNGYFTDKDISTEATDEDMENGVEDEFGVVYSKSGKRLLKCKNYELDTYAIKNGTKVICDHAFGDYRNSCKSLKKIIFPNSVRIIGAGAFQECTSLTDISIPNSVTIIGALAFDGCSNLKEIAIPNSVTCIEARTFSECSSLQHIMIPNSITRIGNGAFHGCSSLKDITIPDSVSIIGEFAFYRCSSLMEFTIPHSISSIPALAFNECTSLHQIMIPNSVIRIGHSAFLGCSSLQQIIIPDSVTMIEKNTFENCSSLQHVVIPDSVIHIGSSAFSECSSLLQITIPISDTYIVDWTFNNCSSLQEITIKNSATRIGLFAFHGCSSLSKIIIPKGTIKRFKDVFMLDKDWWDKLIEQ